MLPKLPAQVPVPVIVVQHMPAQYTSSLANRLNELCAPPVSEGVDGSEVKPGTVTIAPGGHQLKLVRKNGRVLMFVTDDPPENGCRPSVDYMFRSAVEAFEGRVLGLIMTGMGRDGTDGCNYVGLVRETRRRGVINEDEPVSVQVHSTLRLVVGHGIVQERVGERHRVISRREPDDVVGIGQFKKHILAVLMMLLLPNLIVIWIPFFSQHTLVVLIMIQL